MSEDYFPAKPDYEAYWAPVYFEPIVGSGERITCGIGILSHDNKIVLNTINQKRLFCMFGKSHSNIGNMIKLVLYSLEEHIEKFPIDTWVSPISGCYLGKVFKTYGRNIQDIKRQAITQSSFLLTQEEADSLIETDIDIKLKNERWITRIRKRTQEINPEIVRYFNNTVEFSNTKAKIRYGFLDSVLASNFSMIVPSRWGISIEISKAKIYDLELLQKADYLTLPEKYEIIIGVSKKPGEVLTRSAQNKVNDVLEFIKENAKKDQINVFVAEDEVMAARRVIDLVS